MLTPEQKSRVETALVYQARVREREAYRLPDWDMSREACNQREQAEYDEADLYIAVDELRTPEEKAAFAAGTTDPPKPTLRQARLG